MSRAAPIDDVQAASQALHRLAILARIAEIAFLAAWLLIAEEWWSEVGIHLPREKRSGAEAWGVVAAGLAYLAVLGPLAVRMGALEARVARRDSRERIWKALKLLASRAIANFWLVVVLALGRQYLDLWGVALAAIGVWLLCRRIAARQLRAILAEPPGEAATERVQALRAAAAQMGLTDVAITVTSKPPAGVLAGCMPFTRQRDAIIISEVLLDLLDDRETRAILAHEVAHCRLGHARSSRREWTAVFWVGVGLVGLLMLRPWSGEAFRREMTLPEMPRLLLALCLIGLMLRPITAAIGRSHERAANRLALELTGDPCAAIRAYSKSAHYYGITGTPSWYQRLTSNHPPLDEILSQARQFAREQGIPLEDAPQEEASE